MKKIIIILFTILSIGCTKDNIDDLLLLEDEFLTNGNPVFGRWERVVGANGDYTELAIGNINGEESNRVYMCEKNGSQAGLYKGYIDGNKIIWDAEYGVPDFYVEIKDDQFVLTVPDCPICLPTYYFEDPWDGDCGPLP